MDELTRARRGMPIIAWDFDVLCSLATMIVRQTGRGISVDTVSDMLTARMLKEVAEGRGIQNVISETQA